MVGGYYGGTSVEELVSDTHWKLRPDLELRLGRSKATAISVNGWKRPEDNDCPQSSEDDA